LFSGSGVNTDFFGSKKDATRLKTYSILIREKPFFSIEVFSNWALWCNRTVV